MPGKRPRQIQRTTSMSQLGAAKFSQGFPGDTGAPHRGHSCPPKQEFLHVSMDPCAEAGEMASPLTFLEDHVNHMAIDSSAGESLFASRTLRPGLLPVHQDVKFGSEVLPYSNGHHVSYLLHGHNKAVDPQSIGYRRHDVGGSARSTHFLDICYLCSKLLGHGRDVFIYRGDRAFCSVECRHLQIMADERREKSMLTGSKDGSVVTTQTKDSPNTNQVETVAAA